MNKIAKYLIISCIIICGGVMIKLGNNETLEGHLCNIVGGILLIYPALSWYNDKIK